MLYYLPDPIELGVYVTLLPYTKTPKTLLSVFVKQTDSGRTSSIKY